MKSEMMSGVETMRIKRLSGGKVDVFFLNKVSVRDGWPHQNG